MKKRLIAAIAVVAAFGGAAYAADKSFEVKPNEADPGKTYLVQAAWLDAIGCPTNATVYDYNTSTSSPYTDPACPTGDPKDKKNTGLLLAKTGPTTNFAESYAEIKDPPSTVTQLGFDIRKPAGQFDPRGSHCGGGAPRFTIVFKNGSGVFGPGCNSATATTTTGTGWTRLRFAVSYTDVKAIYVEFDEGQDASGGPDQFGLAVLDNIDVNGTLVGDGPTDPNAH